MFLQDHGATDNYVESVVYVCGSHILRTVHPVHFTPAGCVDEIETTFQKDQLR